MRKFTKDEIAEMKANQGSYNFDNQAFLDILTQCEKLADALRAIRESRRK